MKSPIRLAVFLSSGGTTLQNLLDRIADGRLQAQIVLVASNNPDAFGLVRSETAGIITAVVGRKACASREDFSPRLFDLSRSHQADLICFCGLLQFIHIPD